MAVIKGGENGNTLNVLDDGEATVRSIEELEIEHAATLGQAYSWTSVPYTTSANDTMLAVKNTDSDRTLHITECYISTGSVASVYKVHIVKTAYTSAGTEVVGFPMNTEFSKLAKAEAYADETGNSITVANIIRYVSLGVDENITLDLRGYDLVDTHAIAVDVVEASVVEGSVTITGHYGEVV